MGRCGAPYRAGDPKWFAPLQIDGAYATIGRLFTEKPGGRHTPAGVNFDGERHAHLRIARSFRT